MSKVQFVVDLLRTAFTNCDSEIAKYKQMAADASAQATVQSQRADELQAALDQGNLDHAKALADLQAEQAKGLDEITSVLEARINPKQAEDSFSAAVAASETVETPAVVEESAAVIADPTVETPAEVVEAAVEATVEAIVEATAV